MTQTHITVRWSRSHNRATADDAHRYHAAVQGYLLDLAPLPHHDFDKIIRHEQDAAQINKLFDEPLPHLLEQASASYGIPWVILSRAVRVSVPAVRKWRH